MVDGCVGELGGKEVELGGEFEKVARKDKCRSDEKGWCAKHVSGKECEKACK